MHHSEVNVHDINTQRDLEELVVRINNGPPIMGAFNFPKEELWIEFLAKCQISEDVFNQTYSFYDPGRKLHISESYDGYIWISTLGIVPSKKHTKNKTINAFCSQ